MAQGAKSKLANLDFGKMSLPGSAPASGEAAKSGETVPPLPAPAAPPARHQARTMPGALMLQAGEQRSQMAAENESLKEKLGRANALVEQSTALQREMAEERKHWEGALPARLIDPRKIRVSRFANRDKNAFETPEFSEFMAEIAAAGGNRQPIKVRAVTPTLLVKEGDGYTSKEGEPQIEYEIVFGHRRHQACLRQGLMVLAMVDNVDDRTLILDMARENRLREDLSPWEQGMMYLRALQSKVLGDTQPALAIAFEVSQSNISRALALANLPEPIVQAVGPLNLQFRDLGPLSAALEKDRDGALKRAKQVASDGKLSGAAAISAITGTTVAPAIKRRTVTVGQHSFQVSEKGNSYSVTVADLSDEAKQEIENLVSRLMSKG